MDAQELRNLQEAYMEVYNELDEELTGVRKQRAQELIKSKQTASGKAKPGQKEKIDLITRVAAGGPYKGLHRTYKGGLSPTSGRSETTGKHGSARNIPLYGSGNKTKRRRGIDVPDTRNEQVDIYDIILSHLLDEGYAETPEAAEAIMVNMSEEWRDSIIG